MADEITDALQTVFSVDSDLYRGRGFMRRIGCGERPALIVIDLANAWTRPGNAFTCDGMDVILPGVQRLLEAGRAKGIPIVYTTTAYAVTDGPNSDMGLWHLKIPVEVLRLGTEAVAIDERIAPEPGEQVLVKKFASAFHGTPLASFLQAAGVDTVVVTGVTIWISAMPCGASAARKSALSSYGRSGTMKPHTPAFAAAVASSGRPNASNGLR